LEMQQRWTCGAPGAERRDFREGLQYAKRINCIEWMVKKKETVRTCCQTQEYQYFMNWICNYVIASRMMDSIWFNVYILIQ
jgi:hypothetical protein